MDRREFLRDLGVTTAALGYVATAEMTAAAERAKADAFDPTTELGVSSGVAPDVSGHTLVCEFKIGATGWKVYEDLRDARRGDHFYFCGGSIASFAEERGGDFRGG